MKNTLSKVESVQFAINILNQTLQKLKEHDYSSAQTMMAIAKQTLEDTQLDFDNHFRIEDILQRILK